MILYIPARTTPVYLLKQNKNKFHNLEAISPFQVGPHMITW